MPKRNSHDELWMDRIYKNEKVTGTAEVKKVDNQK